MRARSFLLVAMAAMSSALLGGSAPPPPEGAARASAAIDDLQPFVGAWEGVARYPLPERVFEVSVYRQVIRPPLQDYLLLVTYKSGRLAEFDVLTWSHARSSYTLILPGWRPRAVDTGTTIVAVDNHPTNTLSWDVLEYWPGRDGDIQVHTRTTITRRDDVWDERVDRTTAEGQVVDTASYTLHRSAIERWKLPD